MAENTLKRARVADIPAAPSEDMVPAGTCVVCMDLPVTTIMFPCAHAVMCEACGYKVLSVVKAAAPAAHATGDSSSDAGAGAGAVAKDAKCPVCSSGVVHMCGLDGGSLETASSPFPWNIAFRGPEHAGMRRAVLDCMFGSGAAFLRTLLHRLTLAAPDAPDAAWPEKDAAASVLFMMRWVVVYGFTAAKAVEAQEPLPCPTPPVGVEDAWTLAVLMPGLRDAMAPLTALGWPLPPPYLPDVVVDSATGTRHLARTNPVWFYSAHATLFSVMSMGMLWTFRLQRLERERRPFWRSVLEPYQVFVKDLTGRTYTVDCTKRSLVQDISESVAKQGGPPAEYQRLIFAGKTLECSRTLVSYNIGKESTLHLITSVWGC